MSDGYVTRAALADFTADILRDPHTLRLYANEALPAEPTAADFEEVSGPGYIGKPMRLQMWDLTHAPEEATYPQQRFSFGGPAGVVQGWYITRNSDGRLRWYAPLSGGPQRIVNDGDEIAVNVTLGLAPLGDEGGATAEGAAA